MPLQRAAARLAIDIGGTFTDVVVESGGRYFVSKVLTTAGSPEAGVMEAVKVALAESGHNPADIGLIIHGTTLATNALIERKGARTALLTTKGFRDVIELGTESRFDQYDLNLVKPAPLVPREWRIPIPERVAADGSVLLPLDESSVLAAVERLRGGAIESIAVCFLHSYVEPCHEKRTRELLTQHLPQLSISLSSEVSPEVREYERITTTCANAYVQPLVAGYLGRLEDELKAQGFSCQLLLMLSSGGLTTVATARAFPIRLVESGPAGGAIFARNIAERHGERRVVSLDMGGTTAKLCLIDDFKPQTSRVFEVDRSARFRKGSGMPVRIPAIDMVEIGAGGGSIARVDKLGRISVGPDSAGSMPGPVSYGRGGREPTVTDADVALGRIDVDGFAGGRIRLDAAAAAASLACAAKRGGLALSAVEFAYAVAELVDEAMANATRVHAVENGKTLPERTLIAFGGAAPLHVGRIAEKLGIARVIVPVAAGVGSAVGFLLAPISYEVARSLYLKLKDFKSTGVNSMLASMAAEARDVVSRAAPAKELTEQRAAFARYVGQGHEIAIKLPVRQLADDDAAAILKEFEQAYLERYGRLIEGVDVEILAWTLTVSAENAATEYAKPARPALAAQAPVQRQIFDVGEGSAMQTAIFRRAVLSPGSRISGPAMVVEDATSTVIGPRYDAQIADDGSIILMRRRGTA